MEWNCEAFKMMVLKEMDTVLMCVTQCRTCVSCTGAVLVWKKQQEQNSLGHICKGNKVNLVQI